MQFNAQHKPNQLETPLFFHNLRGYDGHLIIKAIKIVHGNVRVIPTMMERYMAYGVSQLQFLDSYQLASQRSGQHSENTGC